MTQFFEATKRPVRRKKWLESWVIFHCLFIMSFLCLVWRGRPRKPFCLFISSSINRKLLTIIWPVCLLLLYFCCVKSSILILEEGEREMLNRETFSYRSDECLVFYTDNNINPSIILQGHIYRHIHSNPTVPYILIMPFPKPEYFSKWLLVRLTETRLWSTHILNYMDSSDLSRC